MKKNTVLSRSKIGVCLLTVILSLFVTAGFSQNAANQSGDCQPSVKMSSLLDAVRVNGGALRIGELHAECVPLPSRRTSVYAYEPYQGAKFVSNLKTSGGTLVNSFVWYGREYPGGVKLTHYEIVGGAEALKELAPGGYTLEFAINRKVFQSFPFSVQTKKSSDPYRPGMIYLLDGKWRDEAVLTAPTAENIMCFNFRLRADYELADVKPKSVPFDLSLIRDRDKKVVAEKRDAKLTLENVWNPYRVCFDRPNREAGKDNSVLKLNEIAAVDGSYTINLGFAGKPYATYKFVVSSGRINGNELPARNIRVTLAANILRR